MTIADPRNLEHALFTRPEMERRWDELNTGVLDYRSYPGNKEIKAKRDEAAAALYKDYGRIPRVGDKENITKWYNTIGNTQSCNSQNCGDEGYSREVYIGGACRPGP